MNLTSIRCLQRQVSREINRLTGCWSLTGLPVVVLPAEPSVEGLPVGVQLVGGPGADWMLLDVADLVQSVTDWHLRRPALSSRPPDPGSRWTPGPASGAGRSSHESRTYVLVQQVQRRLALSEHDVVEGGEARSNCGPSRSRASALIRMISSRPTM